MNYYPTELDLLVLCLATSCLACHWLSTNLYTASGFVYLIIRSPAPNTIIWSFPGYVNIFHQENRFIIKKKILWFILKMHNLLNTIDLIFKTLRTSLLQCAYQSLSSSSNPLLFLVLIRYIWRHSHHPRSFCPITASLPCLRKEDQRKVSDTCRC